MRKIPKYFPDPPVEEHIHVLVEPPPVSTSASGEVLELRKQLALMQELLNKSVYVFDVVVKPKRVKTFKWTVNIEHATLEGLKNFIRGACPTPALENDGAVLNILNDEGKYFPVNDQDLRELLQVFVSKNNLKFTVIVETPSKPFNEWTFPKVCELYGLSDDPNPSTDVYPIFHCGCVDTKNEKYKAALRKLFDELETRVATTPIDLSYEATKSIYSYTYLASATYPFKDQVKIVPESLIEGKNGVGILTMLASSLGHKRKADEIDDEPGFNKVWGIVTDAEKWYFTKCSQDDEGKLSFKLTKLPLFVAYKDKDMKERAEKILGHIIWLLEESQKADLDKEREVKKYGSSSNLAGKLDTVDRS
uniref:Crinkler family protein n=2 Tax=Rhizophagus irregularis TaxID=588596 RepID=U9U2I1_RHIID